MQAQIISTGQMRAQSISIQVTDRERCNARCSFCISRTTPGSKNCSREVNWVDPARLRVGLGYARQLGATHAILTGKADPLQEDPERIRLLIGISREYLPLVDIHTNGVTLRKHPEILGSLEGAGLTMVTLSIASMIEEENKFLMGVKSAAELIPEARDLGLLVRASVVMAKSGVSDFGSLMYYITKVGEYGAHMVVVREIWVPDAYGDYNHQVFDWNQENKIPIRAIEDEFARVADDPTNAWGIRQRDPLPWGTPVFVVGGIFSDPNHGVNVTFARCDEATTGPVLKSIVHKPNGHGYRNWDHNGDILY